jgi:hypothetical protein
MANALGAAGIVDDITQPFWPESCSCSSNVKSRSVSAFMAILHPTPVNSMIAFDESKRSSP